MAGIKSKALVLLHEEQFKRGNFFLHVELLPARQADIVRKKREKEGYKQLPIILGTSPEFHLYPGEKVNISIKGALKPAKSPKSDQMIIEFAEGNNCCRQLSLAVNESDKSSSAEVTFTRTKKSQFILEATIDISGYAAKYKPTLQLNERFARGTSRPMKPAMNITEGPESLTDNNAQPISPVDFKFRNMTISPTKDKSDSKSEDITPGSPDPKKGPESLTDNNAQPISPVDFKFRNMTISPTKDDSDSKSEDITPGSPDQKKGPESLTDNNAQPISPVDFKFRNMTISPTQDNSDSKSEDITPGSPDPKKGPESLTDNNAQPISPVDFKFRNMTISPTQDNSDSKSEDITPGSPDPKNCSAYDKIMSDGGLFVLAESLGPHSSWELLLSLGLSSIAIKKYEADKLSDITMARANALMEWRQMNTDQKENNNEALYSVLIEELKCIGRNDIVQNLNTMCNENRYPKKLDFQ